jgi:5-methyltetrahydrofolate--homocysteine methyltransferase
MTSLMQRFHDGRLLFDGGLGTMLIAKGLRPGHPPEEWNLAHPEIVRDVHLSYLRAGAEVVTANTFGATPSRMAGYGFRDRTDEINRTGLGLAGEAVTIFRNMASAEGEPRGKRADQPASSARRADAAAGERYVAMSVGPTGKMFPPVGKADEAELREEYARQFSGVLSLCDMVLIETMYDLREALIALRAAKDVTTAPVGVTLTYAKNPRGFFTIMGDEATRATRALEDAGADVTGANCTITSAEMLALARVLRESSKGRILCQPNAGQPRLENGIPAYDQTPEDFARDALELFALGVNAVGGCCGTTPAFIQEVSAQLQKP